MADWASLPHDLLGLVGGLMKKFQDFAAFGTVCKSWHAAATKDRFKALWLRERTPYLMLPLRNGNRRDLYSLAEAEIVASVRVPNLSEKKCYESLGWLLAVDKDGSVCLFDPFSTTQIPLPPLNTFGIGSLFTLNCAARPSDPTDPSNFVVALIFRSVLGVAFWKPGDKSWHLTRFKIGEAMYEDITYHAGNYYVFDERYQVISFNILKGFPEQGQVIAPHREEEGVFVIPGIMNVYLVLKMPGSLLLVTRKFASGIGERYFTGTTQFKVYEYDISAHTWTSVKNLGNMALFLGSDIATTIVDSSWFPGTVKANHIYFFDDGERNPFADLGKPGKAVTGQDMGVYNLGNRGIDQFNDFYNGEGFKSKVSHPAWIFPFLWSLPA